MQLVLGKKILNISSLVSWWWHSCFFQSEQQSCRAELPCKWMSIVPCTASSYVYRKPVLFSCQGPDLAPCDKKFYSNSLHYSSNENLASFCQPEMLCYASDFSCSFFRDWWLFRLWGIPLPLSSPFALLFFLFFLSFPALVFPISLLPWELDQLTWGILYSLVVAWMLHTRTRYL